MCVPIASYRVLVTTPPEDEWFPETEATPPTHQSEPLEDWLDEPVVPQRPAVDLWSLADRRILVPATIVVVFFVAVLAAFGVFDSTPRAAVPIITASLPVAPPTTSQST